MTTDTLPAIYVADLSAYNAGHLRGEWVEFDDFDNDPDDIREHISELLKEWDNNLLPGMVGPVEEYAIHDYEGFPKGTVTEYGSIDELTEIAQAMEENDAGAVSAYIENHGSWNADHFEETFVTRVDSWREWVEIYADDMFNGYEVPDVFIRYFDYDAYGRELKYNFWYGDTDEGTYIFYND